MTSKQLINDPRELLRVIFDYYSHFETKSHKRNAVCVPVSRPLKDTFNSDLAQPKMLEIVRNILGKKLPVLPDPSSQADESDQIQALLGQEFPMVVLDCSNTWPDNALGAAAGCVQTPGCLIFLMPDGLDESNASSPFERHLKRRLKRHMKPIPGFIGAWSIHPLQFAPAKAPLSGTDNLWQSPQQTLVTELVARCTGSDRTLDVLLARRGRGKSAALGKVIGALHNANDASNTARVTLTASHQNQVLTVIQHAKNASITYTPLNKALLSHADIVFIDEAGSVPLHVLKQLTEQHTHTVLAGTADGYEGSGRALAIKLSDLLGSELNSSINTKNHTLHHSVRWPDNDSVENMVNDLLLLGLTPKTRVKKSINLSALQHERITSEQLLASDALLNEVFGLLLQAHYQTSTKDLKHLLNQEQLTLWTQTYDDQLTGACLIAHEGNLNDDLIKGIRNGTRRPVHQKLPMLLHRQTNNDSVLHEHYWRVVRIAIDPTHQNQGLGSAFLHAIHCAAKQPTQSPDTPPAFIGASFGASIHGPRFWHKSGYKAIHWGFRLNPRSGQRALAVMLAVHDGGSDSDSVQQAHNQFIDTTKVLHGLYTIACKNESHWYRTLYDLHTLDETLLREILDTSETTSALLDDAQRMALWKKNLLNLHEVWGSLSRSAGSLQTLATLQFPSAKNTKQLAKAFSKAFPRCT